MANTVEFASFNLKKGASVLEFLLVSDRFNSVFLSTQKGYISRKLLRDGEMWADSVLWETKEDVLRAYKNADEDAAACEYFSFMDEESVKVLILPVERSY
jgi:heme-degrading monooxygenase HmoA